MAGEQEEHYDPLFTYGTEAGSFALLEDSGGDAADIGPSGAGTSKGSPERRALLDGPRETRQAGRPFVLTPQRIFRWSPWILTRLPRCLRRHHPLVLSRLLGFLCMLCSD